MIYKMINRQREVQYKTPRGYKGLYQSVCFSYSLLMISKDSFQEVCRKEIICVHVLVSLKDDSQKILRKQLKTRNNCSISCHTCNMGPHRHFPYFCTPLTANHIATQGISQNFDKLSKEREKASNISHVHRQLDKILWLKDF